MSIIFSRPPPIVFPKPSIAKEKEPSTFDNWSFNSLFRSVCLPKTFLKNSICSPIASFSVAVPAFFCFCVSAPIFPVVDLTVVCAFFCLSSKRSKPFLSKEEANNVLVIAFPASSESACKLRIVPPTKFNAVANLFTNLNVPDGIKPYKNLLTLATSTPKTFNSSLVEVKN